MHMDTKEMILKSIAAKKQRGALTPSFIESTKKKMDVFLMADRITEEDYNELLSELAA